MDYIEMRISQLKNQLNDPEVVDHKRVECKLEAYMEMKSVSINYQNDIIQKLRGQLKNCINHLHNAKRKLGSGSYDFDEIIDHANKVLYETKLKS